MAEDSNLADALGEVRQKIRALQAREAQLRQQLLDQPEESPAGARFFVQIQTKRQRRFLRDRLPAVILDDPQFWGWDTRTYVRVLPLEERPPPMRAAGAPMPHWATRRRAPRYDDEEDVVLFEDI